MFPLRFYRSFIHTLTLFFLCYLLHRRGRGERLVRMRRRRSSINFFNGRMPSRRQRRRQRWSRHRFPPALSAKGERDQLRETSLLLLVLEGSASYLTLGDLLSLADDDSDGKNGRGRGGWVSMRQWRQRWKVPIVPPRNLPICGSED